MKTYILVIAIMIVTGAAMILTFNRNPSTTGTTASTAQGTGTALGAKTYTMSDVQKHASEQDCWTVINGKVYDITSFIPAHPGGKEILKACGIDATSLFEGEREHQEKNASGYLPKYLIGDLQ